MFDKNLGNASCDVEANALMERESGFLAKRRQRRIESILKDHASRHSADYYMLINVGRTLSPRTAGGESADACRARMRCIAAVACARPYSE
ncbi:hypothetical protein [Burkholderia sp. BCC1999]|uniref:hypothetical protein n=1 Tax=Burkholderia sp. BCC1999 TaxID=2817448 RepID=UPI002AC36114|nr:hypothetical protein [Burkholderia sp. BCC1999]